MLLREWARRRSRSRLPQGWLHPPGGSRVFPHGEPAGSDREPPQRRARSHICFMNILNTRGGSLPVSASVLPVSPGGKLSYASYGANTIRPTRGAPWPTRSWTTAPPVSLRCDHPAQSHPQEALAPSGVVAGRWIEVTLIGAAAGLNKLGASLGAIRNEIDETTWERPLQSNYVGCSCGLGNCIRH